MRAIRRFLNLVVPALGLAVAAPAAAASQLVPADSIGTAVVRTESSATYVPERAPGDPNFYLTVDLSDRRLYVVRGGEVVNSYAVAIGKPAHPTPRGEFSIRRIIWNPRWVPPETRWARGKKARGPGDPRNPMGRVKMFFQQPDYYVHGTRDVDSLGEAESHGCIRMRNGDVIELAKLVMENGGERREPGWFRRVINRVRHTQDVRLSDPVEFRVRA